MIVKQRYPIDWYYSPLWSHKHVFAAGILTFLWWLWLFPLLYESSKTVFTSFAPFAILMFIIWITALLIVLGLSRGRLRPNEVDEDTYMLMEEDYPEKPKKRTPKIILDFSNGTRGSGSPVDNVSNSAQNTPAMYTARTGRESMDCDHTAAVNVLTTAERDTKNNGEQVEMKEGHNKKEETSSSSSSSSSSSNSEDMQQEQPELSVDDDKDVDGSHHNTAEKTLTPRQIFFSDLLRYSEEPMPRDRRSCFIERPQLTLAEKRKSMPLYLHIGQTRMLSYTDQEAVTEDARKTVTSASDSYKHSLSSPAQHVTSDELHRNMSRLQDEQEGQRRSSIREKHSSSSSGAEYFIANVSKQKSVTSEVYITIDEPQEGSVNRNVHEFAVVGSGEEQKLVAVTDEQKVTSGDNDDTLSDCVFLDEVTTAN